MNELSTTPSLPDLRRISDDYFLAWRDQDPARIAAMHTLDTRFELHAGLPAVVGRAAVQAAFARYFLQWPGFAFDIHRLLFGSYHWVLDWTMRSSVTRESEGKSVAREVRLHCLDLVVISPTGLVARKDTFVDVAQLRAILG